MRKIIVFIIFLIILFIVNIWFYILSDDYKLFLKDLKNNNNDSRVELDEKSFSDSLAQENIDSINEEKTSNKNKLNDANNKLNNENIKSDNLNKNNDTIWKTEEITEVSLWKNYLDIIDLFSSYGINKLHVNSSLFDITDEYPDNYFEYYSKDLTVYLFPTKTYKEVYDIFSVLSSELPFTINEVNNFWEKSFYINLNKDISDRFIRMIISNNWIVFWIKIEKTQYDTVKTKLQSLKSE